MKHIIFYGLGLLLLLSSCSTIHEVHYFKDKITDGGAAKLVPNYYKVEICGYSFLSSSRYVSGYFNQKAINLYFDEFVQPENGKFSSVSSTFSDESGNELVLIFSTNAKAISQQIGSIAKNQVILNSAAALVQKDKIREAESLKKDITGIESDKDNLILETDLYLKDITSKSLSEKKKAIEQLLKTLETK